MVQRILGVLRLDVSTFEQIEHDTTATGQAAGVVAVAAVCQAIGRSISASVYGGGVGAGFLVTLVAAFIGWVVWSALTYWIGTSLFDGKADLGEMLRVIGFAQAPLVLAIIPCFGRLVGGSGPSWPASSPSGRAWTSTTRRRSSRSLSAFLPTS